MNYKAIKKIIIFFLTALSIIALSYFNIYISNYYHNLYFRKSYNIKPYFLFMIVCIIIIFQVIYTYKFFKNK